MSMNTHARAEHHCGEQRKRLVLVGNPNVGKSVVFNYLTGMYVDVSNYPGTTVEVSTGRYGEYDVIDTPGVYGVSSFNDEERVAREVILRADAVLNVVNATHLERDLFLTLQLVDTGLPIVVALNMMDEATASGIEIDVGRLRQTLGVPVVPTVALDKNRMKELEDAIPRAKAGIAPADLDRMIDSVGLAAGSRAESLLVLEDDESTLVKYGLEATGNRDRHYLNRRKRVNKILEQCIHTSTTKNTFASRLAKLAVNPVTGIPMLFGVLIAGYYLMGVFVAQTLVDFTEEVLMEEYYVPWIHGLVTRFMSDNSVVGALLVGEFGVLTMTVTYLLGLLLPLVAGFYLLMALLEDSGYLPRIAVLADRGLNRIGLNGRAIIPMILGLGCVTMATITTRLLGSKRERIIAIFLLALAIPCSAQLGVIAGLIAPLGVRYLVAYVVAVFAVFVAVGTAMHRLLPGKSTDLLIDLPPMRIPRALNVGRKTVARTAAFMLEAGPLFVIGSLLIAALDMTGLLVVIQQAVAPITTGWLGLPAEAANAFIMGIVRRDFGAAGLYSLSLSPVQTLTALVTITLFVPCIASMIIIAKEQGSRQGALMWAAAFSLAFVVGGVVRHTLVLVGW